MLKLGFTELSLFQLINIWSVFMLYCTQLSKIKKRFAPSRMFSIAVFCPNSQACRQVIVVYQFITVSHILFWFMFCKVCSRGVPFRHCPQGKGRLIHACFNRPLSVCQDIVIQQVSLVHVCHTIFSLIIQKNQAVRVLSIIVLFFSCRGLLYLSIRYGGF